MKASIIIPAYNEEERIESVLQAVGKSELASEIIVVDDGSTDKTSQVAESSEVPSQLVRLPINKGKANALAKGVEEASYSTFLFLDADLVGLQSDHVDDMIKAYDERKDNGEKKYDMVIGVFRKGRINTDISQRISPYLSGQRVLSTEQWNELLKKWEESDGSFGVEIALAMLSLENSWNTRKVKLEGVTHVMKEEKRGLREGLRARLKMYGDIIKTTLFRAWHIIRNALRKLTY